MKTELLIQMDGIRGSANASVTSSKQVFVMAASNLPWDLDVAVLRRYTALILESLPHPIGRLEKRVMVPLPSREAKVLMMRKHLEDRAVADIPYDEVSPERMHLY